MLESLSVLRSPSFRRVLFSRFSSLIGTAMAPIALAFGILSIPGEGATAVGLVLASTAVARVGLLLFGGAIADRFPRARVMVVSDLCAGTSQSVVAVLFLTHHASIAPLMVLGAVNGASAALFLPASGGLVPQVVEKEWLQPANAMLRLTRNSATIVGAGLVAIVLPLAGPGWTLAVDAFSFFASALWLWGIRVRGFSTPQAMRPSILVGVRDGWREVSSRTWLWAVILQFGVLNACYGAGITVLGPVVAQKRLGGPVAWSVVMAAASIGYFVGSALSLRVHVRRPLLVGTLVTFGFVPPFFALGLGAPLWVIVLASFGNGVCGDLFTVLWDTSVQRHVPHEALSRVTAYDALGSYSLGPIALAVVGPVAALLGVPQTLVVGGVLMIVVNALVLGIPGVRNLPAHPIENSPPAPRAAGGVAS